MDLNFVRTMRHLPTFNRKIFINRLYVLQSFVGLPITELLNQIVNIYNATSTQTFLHETA